MEQCIDYWAVDWNYRDDTFHNEWQSYRTKKDPNIDLVQKHIMKKKGKFIVLVKVIDILGNDTTKAINNQYKIMGKRKRTVKQTDLFNIQDYLKTAPCVPALRNAVQCLAW